VPADLTRSLVIEPEDLPLTQSGPFLSHRGVLAAMQHAFGVAAAVAEVLEGCSACDPGQYGLTTAEERAACRNQPQVLANLAPSHDSTRGAPRCLSAHSHSTCHCTRGNLPFSTGCSSGGCSDGGVSQINRHLKTLQVCTPLSAVAQHLPPAAALTQNNFLTRSCRMTWGARGMSELEIMLYASLPQWPALAGGAAPQPPNAELRLYGGAAFERVIDEFQEAASLLAMPPGKELHPNSRRRVLRKRK